MLCPAFKRGEVRSRDGRTPISGVSIAAYASGPVAVRPCWDQRVRRGTPQTLPLVEESEQRGALPLDTWGGMPAPRERMPILRTPLAVGWRGRRLARETQADGSQRLRVQARGRTGSRHRACRRILGRVAEGEGEIHAVRSVRHAGERATRLFRSESPGAGEREEGGPGESASGRRVRPLQRHEISGALPGAAAEGSRPDRDRGGDTRSTPTASRRHARTHSRSRKRDTCDRSRTRRTPRCMTVEVGSRSHLNLYLVQRMRRVARGL